MNYDVHNLVKWAQLTVMSFMMTLLLVGAIMLESICGILLAVFGLLLFTAMKGFHFMWFALTNMRRSMK